MIVQKILEKTKRRGRKTSEPAGSHAIYSNPQTLTPSRFTGENDEGQAVPSSCPSRSKFIFSHNIYGLDRNIKTIEERRMEVQTDGRIDSEENGIEQLYVKVSLSDVICIITLPLYLMFSSIIDIMWKWEKFWHYILMIKIILHLKLLCYRVFFFFLTASFAQIKFDVLCVYFYALNLSQEICFRSLHLFSTNYNSISTQRALDSLLPIDKYHSLLFL